MRLLLSSLLAVSTSACLAANTGSESIEIRSGEPAISGSSFACTGTWPRADTPCSTRWSSTAATTATVDGSHVLLTLTRHPTPVDGGATMVTLTLDLDASGQVVSASATADSTSPDLRPPSEHDGAVGGYVLPVDTRVGDRVDGQFELDFAWGSIRGTYDAAP